MRRERGVRGEGERENDRRLTFYAYLVFGVREYALPHIMGRNG